MEKLSDVKYSRLSVDSEKENRDTPTEPDTSKRSTHIRAVQIFPWLLSFFLACLSLFLLFSSQPPTSLSRSSYESGFKTDITSPPLHLHERRFTGSPHFHINGSAWRSPVDPTAPWPENHQYFGEPSRDIDEAWHQLIGERYFSVSEEEAKTAWGDRYQVYRDPMRGGYTAGLDMFHTLHCLNALRKALRRDYYPFTDLHGNVHLEHCLDLLRQEVQCYGSTTLIPQKHFEGLEQPYIDSDQVHTCRDFNALREFTSDRQEGGKLYVSRVQWMEEDLERIGEDIL